MDIEKYNIYVETAKEEDFLKLLEKVNFHLGLNLSTSLPNCSQAEFEFILEILSREIAEPYVCEDGEILCSTCHSPILNSNVYCTNCGQKVYWND